MTLHDLTSELYNISSGRWLVPGESSENWHMYANGGSAFVESDRNANKIIRTGSPTLSGRNVTWWRLKTRRLWTPPVRFMGRLGVDGFSATNQPWIGVHIFFAHLDNEHNSVVSFRHGGDVTFQQEWNKRYTRLRHDAKINFKDFFRQNVWTIFDLLWEKDKVTLTLDGGTDSHSNDRHKSIFSFNPKSARFPDVEHGQLGFRLDYLNARIANVLVDDAP